MACTDEAILDKIRKLLESAGVYSKVQMVIGRIFQRVPNLLQEIEDQVEEEGGGQLARKRTMIELVLEKIEDVCQDAKLAHDLGVPAKLTNYLAYIDLVLLRVKSDSFSHRRWTVYQLEEYPARPDSPLLIDEEAYSLRSKLKAEMLKKGYLASIQTEGDGSRVWARVTAAKTTKDKYKDRKKLEKTRPSYLVYYPGEPYLYTITRMADSVISALVSGLGCENSRKLELSGKCVASLRTLRLGRDARDDEMRSAEDRKLSNRFSVFNQAMEAALDQADHPKLERVTLHVTPEDSAKTKLHCTITIAGEDVIGGVQDLVEAEIISSPPPDWVRNLATAGTNKFKLRAQTSVSRDDDMESVLSKAWV